MTIWVPGGDVREGREELKISELNQKLKSQSASAENGEQEEADGYP